MLRGFFGGRSRPHGSTQSLNALDEPHQIEDAMHAVSYILNDDLQAAEDALGKGNSPFHRFALGVVSFLRATLGFERDVIREASERLSEAEATAEAHQRKAQHSIHSSQSSIYPAGTEFALCLAESQLMLAVVGVLTESLTESVKGFYKLRKAYLTLEGILEVERQHLQGKSSSSVVSSSRPSTGLSSTAAGKSKTSSATSTPPSGPTQPSLQTNLKVPSESKFSTSPIGTDTSTSADESDDVGDFVDADEDLKGVATPAAYIGHLDVTDQHLDTAKTSTSEKDTNATSATTVPPPAPTLSRASTVETTLFRTPTVEDGPETELIGDNVVDIFIHSGSNLCFGILLIVISMIPPAFAMLLRIVGFKGDRARGIKMLWQASKFNNINGAMAGLVLFGYYNGLVGFCDILPARGEGSYPKDKLKALLVEMRERYPESRLWQLEDARMMASEKQLEKAVELVESSSESKLKQVEALQWFEKSLNCMYMHDYEKCSSSFLKCVSLNNWSHALYYYIAGAAQVELYRMHKDSDPKVAAHHAEKANELLHKVPQHIGRKRFMARQLPFDVFVNRKIEKWTHRSKTWNVPFIDAVGVSPIEEMIYFWNGHRRMRPEHLEFSLQRLDWSLNHNPLWEKETLDEQAILALLKSATLRNMGKRAEAKEILEREVLSHPWPEFKGHLTDNWTAPCAHYEMATNIWQEVEAPEKELEKVQECGSWLEKVAGWESYDLDARIGLRVETGRDTLRRFGYTAE